MLLKVYRYDIETEEYIKISAWEMLKLKDDPNEITKYLNYKENLYWSKNNHQKMVFVSKNNIGFRRYPRSQNNIFVYRGEPESMTHLVYKEAISELKIINIYIADEKTTLFVTNVEVEKDVYCNGRHYKCDIYLKLSKETSSEFIDKYGNEIYLELYHTCPVDVTQANDFEIQGLTLFEYSIPQREEVYSKLTLDGFEKQKEIKKKLITDYGLKDIIVFSNNHVRIAKWYKGKREDTITARILGKQYTIKESTGGIEKEYTIIYSGINDNPIFKKEYNGKRITTIEEAKNVAETIAIKLHNKQSIDN